MQKRVVSTYVNPHVRARLDAWAKAHAYSVSEAAARLIERALDAEDKPAGYTGNTAVIEARMR